METQIDNDTPIIIQHNTPLEYLAYNIPKQAITILILGIISIIAPIGLLGIQFLFLGMQFTDLIPSLGYLLMGAVYFGLSLIIYKSVIKKGEVALMKKVRGGLILFDKVKYGKKIYFNKNDPSTQITTIWSGAGTLEYSGAKILQLKEGSTSNENINLCVAESDWTKNLSSMVKLKTYADLAESELLENKGLLNMKWQDMVLIIIALIGMVTIGVLIGLTPSMISEAVMDSLSSGTLQNIVQSVITATPKVV